MSAGRHRARIPAQCVDSRRASAKWTLWIGREREIGKMLRKRIVSEQPADQRFPGARDEFDGFERLQTADHTAKRAEHACLTATRHAASFGRRGEETPITGPAASRSENRNLAFKLEYAAVNQRLLGEERRIVVQITRRKIIRAVDDHIVTGKDFQGVFRGDPFRMFDDADVRICRAQLSRGRCHFVFAEADVVVKQLPLKVVRGDAIEVCDPQYSNSRRCEVERCGAPESTGTDDEHASGGDLSLPLRADFAEENMPAISGELRGREHGWRIEHRGEVSVAIAGSQMKLRPRTATARIGGMRCLGIDYGTRRIGLSYGDELGVATPLPALIEADEAKRWVALAGIVKQRRATDLVLGYPFNMDGSVGFKAKEVDAFAARLRAEFGLPVHLVDERLTSYEAESSIAKSKRREVRASGIVDSRAATLILQDFLNQKFGVPPPLEG